MKVQLYDLDLNPLSWPQNFMIIVNEKSFQVNEALRSDENKSSFVNIPIHVPSDSLTEINEVEILIPMWIEVIFHF